MARLAADGGAGQLNLVPPTFLPLDEPGVDDRLRAGRGHHGDAVDAVRRAVRQARREGHLRRRLRAATGAVRAHRLPDHRARASSRATVVGRPRQQRHLSVRRRWSRAPTSSSRAPTSRIGYGAGGFFFEGKVTIAPSESMELEVGAPVLAAGRLPDPRHHAAGQERRRRRPPARRRGTRTSRRSRWPSIGVAVARPQASAWAWRAGYRMPKIKLKNPKIEGGLEALDKGGLPPISFGGSIAMGAYIALSFSVQIVGEIQLLIADGVGGHRRRDHGAPQPRARRRRRRALRAGQGRAAQDRSVRRRVARSDRVADRHAARRDLLVHHHRQEVHAGVGELRAHRPRHVPPVQPDRAAARRSRRHALRERADAARRRDRRRSRTASRRARKKTSDDAGQRGGEGEDRAGAQAHEAPRRSSSRSCRRAGRTA